MGFDLAIRGATVVTPGYREAADIGIADGRIAQLGGTMTGAEEFAAGGLLAIPGGVDAHTHLAHRGLGDRVGFPIWVDDFWSGSRAAIACGITGLAEVRRTPRQFVLADGEVTARPGDGEWLRRNRTAGVLPSRPRRRFQPGFTQVPPSH